MNNLPNQSATHTDVNGNQVEDMMFTYSEGERQENEINRENAQLVFNIKYLTVNMNAFRQGLSGNEAIVYSFVTSFTRNGRFYFTNKQIADLFNISENTVTNIFKTLVNKELVSVSYRRKVDGGQIRFVNLSSDFEAPLTKIGISNSQKLGGNIKDNNISYINITKVELALDVWDFYVKETGSKEKLTPKRKAHINARLKEFTKEQLQDAIRNAWNQPFYRGKNSRAWKLNADYMFRSYEIIEKFLNESSSDKPLTAEEIEKIDDPILRFSMLNSL